MTLTTRELRAAQPADAGRLRDIATAAYGLYLSRMDRPPAPLLADYGALVAKGQVSVLAVGGALVGFFVAFPRAADYFVENVAVSPACQGAGHGRFLMAAAEDAARTAGKDTLRLYTNEVMTENVAFYEGLGYVVEERRQEEGYRRIFFVKRL